MKIKDLKKGDKFRTERRPGHTFKVRIPFRNDPFNHIVGSFKADGAKYGYLTEAWECESDEEVELSK